MSAFVDFQGFKHPQSLFVLKELSVLTLGVKTLSKTYIFAAPCGKENLTAEYCEIIEKSELTDHGIPWDEGDIDYREVATTIHDLSSEKFDYVYVKGEEKKKWLSSLVKSVTIINLDDLGCPKDENLFDLPTMRHMNCHKKCVNYNCAAENSHRYKLWFLKIFTLKANLRRSIMLYCAVDSLADMNENDIAALPLMAIIKFGGHEVETVWDKLSSEQKNNPIIAGYRKCKEHSVDYADNDIADCIFYTFKKDCEKCL